jgi:hypothetical protein
MEQKNRLIIVLAITVIMAAAMFASFGRNLFALNTASVVLPTAGADGSAQTSAGDETPSSAYQTIEVTPETVQSVIATLSRPESYSREFTVETFWGTDGADERGVQVWYDRGWAHSKQTLPSGAVRHDLVGEDVAYYWYEGSQQYETTPADEQYADLSQHIPTYETVLELDEDDITAAAYVQRGEVPCILVEVQRKDPARTERYWVSVDDGLLTAAELEREGRVVYRMSAVGNTVTPCPAGASFALPDGTLLHSF